MPRNLRCAYAVHILRELTVEWDEEKRRRNFQKHRVEFADAVTALDDDHAITVSDGESAEEERFVTLAADAEGRILVVVYTWRGETIRLISARQATKRERQQYEDR